MTKTHTVTGQDLREMFAASTNWLEKSSADIDVLNVFPVPDGDTGTNMLLTMRSTMEEAYRAPDHSATAVADAMAKGALMGARGNSGVILSQIIRGLAKGLTGKENISGADLAAALKEASENAYRGISNPVEGTILTVMKEAARAAQEQVDKGNDDPVQVMEAAVATANEAVANTPRLLKVLREAGVVDAGGQGLYTILDGCLRYLKGEAEGMRFRKPQIIVSDVTSTKQVGRISPKEEIPYGYCTEFMIKGQELDIDYIRKRLVKKGESLIVVGDPTAIRVHIHALSPGDVITFATKLGTLHQVSMRNMDEQHQDFLEMQHDKSPAADTGIIAVVSGDGLTDVFKSLGAAAIVQGGQTMNPSIKDLLTAVEGIDADKVIILPNNKNVILTASKVQELTQKNIEVVPSETIPAGVAALLAFDYEANLKTNTEIMKSALSNVRSIEITKAARSTQMGNLKISRKQPIGFLDGDLVAVGDSDIKVVEKIFARINLKNSQVLTIYYGGDADPEESSALGAQIREKYPHLQIEVIRGGQPHYNYIISVE